MTELKLSLSNHNSFLSSSKPETCMKSVGFLGLEYILASLCLDHLSFCIPSLYITYFSFKWLLQCEIFSLPSNQNSEFPVAKSNGLCWSWGLVSCPTHGCSSSQGLENSLQAPEDLTLFFFSWAWVCVCLHRSSLPYEERLKSWDCSLGKGRHWETFLICKYLRQGDKEGRSSLFLVVSTDRSKGSDPNLKNTIS